jgi:hypothetical protein
MINNMRYLANKYQDEVAGPVFCNPVKVDVPQATVSAPGSNMAAEINT